MFQNFDQMQKLAKANMDATLKSFDVMTKNTQTITNEIANYTKRSFENSTKTMEKLISAKSLDKAIEAQSEFAKAAYEDYFAQAAKVGKLCTDMSKEALKPYEDFTARAPTP